jgi:hypothetical protein
MDEETTEQTKPVDHEVLIDQSRITEDGEYTFICALCQQPLILIYRKDEGYSLRAEDAANPLLGGIKITYVEEQHG